MKAWREGRGPRGRIWRVTQRRWLNLSGKAMMHTRWFIIATSNKIYEATKKASQATLNSTVCITYANRWSPQTRCRLPNNLEELRPRIRMRSASLRNKSARNSYLNSPNPNLWSTLISTFLPIQSINLWCKFNQANLKHYIDFRRIRNLKIQIC